MIQGSTCFDTALGVGWILQEIINRPQRVDLNTHLIFRK